RRQEPGIRRDARALHPRHHHRSGCGKAAVRRDPAAPFRAWHLRHPMTNWRERRASPRLPATLTVQYRSGEELRRDLVVNQSKGGVFIRTSRPLPIGTAVELVFEVAGELPIRARGRVVWERLLGRGSAADEPEGMGIAFEAPVDARLGRLLGREGPVD